MATARAGVEGLPGFAPGIRRSGKRRNRGATVALIPLRPRTLVENPRCGIIKRSFEIVVAEVLPDNFDVVARRVQRRNGAGGESGF
jgi:hypothetical protein